MKKRYIIAGALIALSSNPLRAQKDSVVFKRTAVDKTEIEILYSQYNQDGNNSAVTGGIGTEKLTVYAPGFKVTRKKNKNVYELKAGADVISSASTDRINFVMSSPSSKDLRSYLNVGYTRIFEKQRMTFNMGSGVSVESDYSSIPLNLGLSYTEKNQMRSWFFNTLLYFDDLRWGRLNKKLRRPDRLIYPSELRYKQWYDDYLRRSYNIKFGMTQIINKRNIIGIYPEITYQTGLLATPFHRVYFNDGSLRVENLPDHRLKGLLGLKLNSFAGNRTILKNRVDLYADDFGIMGIAFENETSLKISPRLTVSPSVRADFQQGSDYFAPYQFHDPEEKFYSSDYDLSTMNTYQAGIGLNYAVIKNLSRKLFFDDIKIRYAFYKRSNQLRAHIISCVINLVNFRSNRKK